jgi:hypothetical protein
MFAGKARQADTLVGALLTERSTFQALLNEVGYWAYQQRLVLAIKANAI